MLLKEYRKLSWPRNLWSTVLRKQVSDDELPNDWEQVLNYIFEARLDVKKAEILQHYFHGGMTFQEIGDIYGLTSETVRQHASKAIRTMRHPSWRVFLLYGLERGKAVLAEERVVAEHQRLDRCSVETADCPIEALDLSVRTYNCLKRAGIDTVEQLSQCSDADLARLRNLGARSLREIKDCLVKVRVENIEKINNAQELTTDLISREALMETIENIDWYSVSEEGVFHEGARNEGVAFVRYADVSTAIKAAPVAQTNPEARAWWEICIEPNTFDTYGKPDKYARCTHCGFRWGDLYSVKKYFKNCPGCGAKMEAYK